MTVEPARWKVYAIIGTDDPPKLLKDGASESLARASARIWRAKLKLEASGGTVTTWWGTVGQESFDGKQADGTAIRCILVDAGTARLGT